MNTMMRYGLVVDTACCTGCFNCFLACRDEHCGNDYPGVALAQPESGQRWIDVRVEERGTFPKVKVSYLPVPCLHCAEASCMQAASGDAVYRRADGIVIIDPEKAAGQRQIVSACPHGAVFWNEARNVPQKCTLCAHLLDAGWKEPRCVEACPTGALVFGDLNDPSSSVSRLSADRATEDLHPEYGLKPRVRHRGLPKRFIAGDVAFADRPEEPAAGVRVTLSGGARALDAVTDSFGDFELEGVEPGARYVVRVEQPGYRARELPVPAATDLNLGTIVLEPL
jgi:Fe-S-cluster-containing dehydrogenase component